MALLSMNLGEVCDPHVGLVPSTKDVSIAIAVLISYCCLRRCSRATVYLDSADEVVITWIAVDHNVAHICLLLSLSDLVLWVLQMTGSFVHYRCVTVSGVGPSTCTRLFERRLPACYSKQSLNLLPFCLFFHLVR
jgi:hypothetical protein